jgi:hypothetical protein
MFRLTKWYLDLVTDDGTALIAYAASLEWAGVSVHFASTLLARPNASPVDATAWSRVVLPDAGDETISFRHDALRFEGEWRRASAPIEATLLDDDSGRLHWSCLMPSAEATASFAGETLTGRGYAERLTMTRLPWTLPFNRLRWGRFGTPAHALVWIGWSGATSRQWVWLDGVPEPGAALSDDGVRGLSEGRELQFRPGRVLCDRRALQVISRQLTAVDTLLAGPIRDLRETKRLDRGVLSCRDEPTEEGWAIHEVVSW